jgi:hypothetical protein
MTTAWGRVEPARKSNKPPDYFPYIFAIVAGALAGWIDIKLDDLLFTALLVLAPCMLLGVLRPAKPWRWVLVVGLCVPIVELLAHFYLGQRLQRSQLYGALLTVLPGIAGAYGGSMMRGVINNLRAGN